MQTCVRAVPLVVRDYEVLEFETLGRLAPGFVAAVLAEWGGHR